MHDTKALALILGNYHMFHKIWQLSQAKALLSPLPFNGMFLIFQDFSEVENLSVGKALLKMSAT